MPPSHQSPGAPVANHLNALVSLVQLWCRGRWIRGATIVWGAWVLPRINLSSPKFDCGCTNKSHGLSGLKSDEGSRLTVNACRHLCSGTSNIRDRVPEHTIPTLAAWPSYSHFASLHLAVDHH